MPSLQGRYFLLTIPYTALTYIPDPKDELAYVKGQREVGESGYEHWQLVAYFSKKVTITRVKEFFCEQAHVELSKSKAAEEYVWKEQSRVEGTQFERGKRPFKCNSKVDWDAAFEAAKSGDFDSIPAGVRLRCYNSITKVRRDNIKPPKRPGTKVKCYWGGTGLGKTRKAWYEAGEEAYVKDPNTKWWDGYNGQKRVIIDEFTGLISISHILRWLDMYPVIVETKGSAMPLLADEFWITSNIDPRLWYADINEEQKKALLRRMEVTHFVYEWTPPPTEDNADISFDFFDEL